MKISILTATFNRAEMLHKLYQSLVTNSEFNVKLEWLIMDDGSDDDTKLKVQEFEQDVQHSQNKNLEIKYFFQPNQGKMRAINNLMQYVTGDLIIECDSDDYLTENAVRIY